MEPRPNSLGPPASSFRSVASSSSHASSLTARSFDFSGYPPQSEMEEVPSFRWLPSGDLPAAVPSETILRSSGRERDPALSSFRQRRQREDTRPSKGRQTAFPSRSKNIFSRLFRMNVLQYAHHDISDAADPNAAVTYSQFPLLTDHQMHDLEGGDAEYLPGIEAFQIIGDAKPGGTLIACGFPINGTALCMFQWVCHLQDGTWQYIEGATNPEYLVTADDVDKLISVECVALDDSCRQGELLKLFANDQKVIKFGK